MRDKISERRVDGDRPWRSLMEMAQIGATTKGRCCRIGRKYPTGIFFVPSVDGLSHNEAEFTSADDCAAGANVLLHAALRSARYVREAA